MTAAKHLPMKLTINLKNYYGPSAEFRFLSLPVSGSVLDENGDIEDGLYAVDTYDAEGVPERTYLNFHGEKVVHRDRLGS